tara:strand:- start:54 stop:305 length:252 start_codon:yes stop_codon:yes gene_type:complete
MKSITYTPDGKEIERELSAEEEAEVKKREKEDEKKINAMKYAVDRQMEYPNIGDQLDDLYHAGAFSAEMTAKIKKVKDDNPKG